MNLKNNIKIVYQYDGSKFFGFQRQPNKKTVQGTIERQIYMSFGERVNLISSGRTDKGVHATGQVSNFLINEKINIDAIKRILNKKLRKEIIIDKIDKVNHTFNSRYDAKKRTYKYYFKKEEKITPFESNYISPVSFEIDINKFNEIMKIYKGSHNFANFMKIDKSKKNTNRTIYEVECKKYKDKFEITVQGNSFLKTMIRIMIGTAFEVYSGKLKVDYIKEMLVNYDKNYKKILAPSEGLYLVDVIY